MRTYYERHLICNKCKDSMRQTVYNLPLNRIGRKMEVMWQQDFVKRDSCNAGIRYTDWKLISDRDYKHNLQRTRVEAN